MYTRPHTTDPPADPSGTGRRRRGSESPGPGVLVVALALLVSAAAAVVVASIVSHAEARFAGSTSNRGSFLESGEVRLELVAEADDPAVERAELAITGANLLPGETVQRCIVLGYTGTIEDADVRIHARDDRAATSGAVGLGDLAPYLLVSMAIGSGLDPACDDFVVLDDAGGGGDDGDGDGDGDGVDHPDPSSGHWDGTLWEFGRDHHDYATGLSVLPHADDGATATIRITVTLADDNRAQGLSSAFWLVFEVRP